MAVRTHWTVEHACSHSVDHDLSNRPADKRAGFARWLASKDCTDCWKAARDADSESKEEWFSELLGSRDGRWRSFIRTRRFGNQFGWLCLKALRSERALAGRGRWGAGGVGTCVGAACRGFPRNPVESQRPEVVWSCSMLR